MQGLDLDSDGVSNADEATEETNPYSGDTDFDGMTDSEEIFAGCNPLVDDAHADYDGDRYPNIFEVKNSSDPFAVGSIPTPHYVVDPNGGGTHTSSMNRATGPTTTRSFWCSRAPTPDGKTQALPCMATSC
ncbi:hypothetical protein [Verrucomicrobium spinosum]|uniref:hypothetical protein n=1 Tax=Verrucomicrobium spinosum TaxID=2736 RepID=UPI00210D881B|nr:hypothetical protein [Verrucomicrobium spinosum]